METDVVEEVKRIVAELLAVDPQVLTPETRLEDDLGADTFDFVELVMILEEMVGGAIPENVAGGLRTVGDVVECVLSIGSQGDRRTKQS